MLLAALCVRSIMALWRPPGRVIDEDNKETCCIQNCCGHTVKLFLQPIITCCIILISQQNTKQDHHYVEEQEEVQDPVSVPLVSRLLVILGQTGRYCVYNGSIINGYSRMLMSRSTWNPFLATCLFAEYLYCELFDYWISVMLARLSIAPGAHSRYCQTVANVNSWLSLFDWILQCTLSIPATPALAHPIAATSKGLIVAFCVPYNTSFENTDLSYWKSFLSASSQRGLGRDSNSSHLSLPFNTFPHGTLLEMAIAQHLCSPQIRDVFAGQYLSWWFHLEVICTLAIVRIEDLIFI